MAGEGGHPVQMNDFRRKSLVQIGNFLCSCSFEASSIFDILPFL
jgi:hypothetical protein